MECVICSDFSDVAASRLELIDTRRAEITNTQKGKEFIAPPINLKTLSCDRITLFPEIFCHTYLLDLDIRDCTGISLLANINRLKLLKYLTIRDCGMKILPELTLYELKCLDLSQNDLQNLPRGLPIGCPKLHILYLNYNANLNRLCESRFANLNIRIQTEYTKLLSCATLLDIYRASDENFELVKLRYRSIVTLLVAKKFGKWVTQMIAKRAYYGWFTPREINKKFKKG